MDVCLSNQQKNRKKIFNRQFSLFVVKSVTAEKIMINRSYFFKSKSMKAKLELVLNNKRYIKNIDYRVPKNSNHNMLLDS